MDSLDLSGGISSVHVCMSAETRQSPLTDEYGFSILEVSKECLVCIDS